VQYLAGGKLVLSVRGSIAAASCALRDEQHRGLQRSARKADDGARTPLVTEALQRAHVARGERVAE
jgi:hypothetical protein